MDRPEGVDRFEIRAGDLARVMGEARDVLRHLRPQGGADASFDEIHGTGSAADDHVRLVVRRDGRVDALDLDRHARGLGSEALSASILSAYAMARDDVRQQVRELIDNHEMPDPYDLNEKLLDAQTVTLQQSVAMIDSFKDAINKIGRASDGE